MSLSLSQAIRNAVESELAAMRFYRALAALDLEPKVQEFFQEMAEQELHHADWIRDHGRRLVEGELADKPEGNVRVVETSPEWMVADTITPAQALQLALDNEYKASLYYDAIADSCPEPEAEFFRQLSKTEEEHAKKLRQMKL